MLDIGNNLNHDFYDRLVCSLFFIILKTALHYLLYCVKGPMVNSGYDQYPKVKAESLRNTQFLLP